MVRDVGFVLDFLVSVGGVGVGDLDYSYERLLCFRLSVYDFFLDVFIVFFRCIFFVLRGSKGFFCCLAFSCV